MKLNLNNVHVVVVGGTNGIGLSISEGFLKEGAIVHIIARNENKVLINELEKKHNSRINFYQSYNKISLKKNMMRHFSWCVGYCNSEHSFN